MEAAGDSMEDSVGEGVGEGVGESAGELCCVTSRQGLPLVLFSPQPETFLLLLPPNMSHKKCLR